MPKALSSYSRGTHKKSTPEVREHSLQHSTKQTPYHTCVDNATKQRVFASPPQHMHLHTFASTSGPTSTNMFILPRATIQNLPAAYDTTSTVGYSTQLSKQRCTRHAFRNYVATHNNTRDSCVQARGAQTRTALEYITRAHLHANAMMNTTEMHTC